jgi:hypothetical protein
VVVSDGWAPMLARLDPSLPQGPNWVYEPKWDGFRVSPDIPPSPSSDLAFSFPGRGMPAASGSLRVFVDPRTGRSRRVKPGLEAAVAHEPG